MQRMEFDFEIGTCRTSLHETINEIKQINPPIMAKKIVFICCLLLSFMLQAQTEMKNTSGKVTIENKHVSLTFDLGKGVYSVKNIPRNITTYFECIFPGRRIIFHRYHRHY